jgi:tetratricopeptide (TPR) repeat protein
VQLELQDGDRHDRNDQREAGRHAAQQGAAGAGVRQYQPSGEDFTEVVRLDPKNKFGYYNLGLIAQNAGNKTAAKNDYQVVLTIDPKYTPALYNFGILRAQDGATADAISLYRRATASDPKFADAHFNLGLLLRASGQTEAGNTEVQTAVRLDPTLAAKARAQGVPLPGK